MSDLASQFTALVWILKISADFERRLGSAAGDSQARFKAAADIVAKVMPESHVAAFFQKDHVEEWLRNPVTGKGARHLRLVAAEEKPNDDDGNDDAP